MDVIAKQPYILIEEPEVVVMNTQTDDILFEIMTKSRTSDDLIHVYKTSKDQMNSLQRSVFLTRLVKFMKQEELALLQAGQNLDSMDC